MTKCALYARVSSTVQAREGDSIPAQLDALHKYAKDHNYQIIGTFIDDGISGTKNDRDELQNLLKLVESDQVDLILVTKMDRLHRSLRNFLNMQDLLQKHNCHWLAIWEPIYDSSTPQGRMIINTMMNLAEFEAGQTSDRIRQVQAFKVSKGEVISGTCTPGYRIEDKHYVLDPDKVDAVRLAFDVFNRTGSFAETIRATYGTGLPTTTNGIKNMLRREIYIGKRYGLDGFAPALIDVETFESVQKQIKMERRPSRSKHEYLFSGLLVCAECGAVMASHPRKERGKVKLAYRCPKHFQRTVKQCDNTKVVYEDVLERFLVAQFPALVIDQIEVLEAKQAPIRSAQRERERIERRLDRLKDLYLDEQIDLEEYRKDKEHLLAELDAVRLEGNTDTSAIDALKSLVGLDLTEIYADLTKPEKRLFWRSVVKQIRFDKNRNFFVDFV